jgi:hypothetical protein
LLLSGREASHGNGEKRERILAAKKLRNSLFIAEYRIMTN